MTSETTRPSVTGPSQNGDRPSLGWTLAGKDVHADFVFIGLALRHGLGHIVHDSRAIGPGDRELPDDLGDRLLVTHSRRSQQIVLLRGRVCARITIGQSSASAEVAADSEESGREMLDEIFAALPGPKPLGDSTPLAFWSVNSNGSTTRSHRSVPATTWSGLSSGYEQSTRAGLVDLIGLEPPVNGGRLLLWHGEPGTGKTYALRALAHEWRRWCAIHVVTDPEHLLKAGMGYLSEVMSAGDFEHEAKREWKLIVLEDAGELLSLDARQQAGQGLSRLLNASDGLLAQGANVLFLITTNEPLGAIHPAIHRPGRCLSEIEFLALPTDQANQWLGEQGNDQRVSAPTLLAELFAIRDGRQRPAPAKVKVGFAA